MEEEKLDFYGQRPWRPGKLNSEPADLIREAAAIQALQYKEKTVVNHSVSQMFLKNKFKKVVSTEAGLEE